MKTEQIEQIVAATDNLIAQSISDAVAEQFKKQNKVKPSINTNMIIGIVGLVILSFMAFFIVAATNNNANAIKDTITESVGTQNAAIMGLTETIENGNADVIAGIDNVQTNIIGLQSSVDAVKEQNTKIQDKVQSLSQMTANADAAQIRKFEKCMTNRYLNNPTSNTREDLLWCKHHLG
jgi:hypothetical protein